MQRVLCNTLMATLTLSVSALYATPSQAREEIPIKVDEATLVKLPDRVATIIIGNPIIADATLQTGGFMVLTGKSFGQTNIIALDRKGQILMERTINVIGQPGAVTVFRGGTVRETYACGPTCEPRLTLGDDSAFFGKTNSQSSGRAARAEGASPVSGTMVTGKSNDEMPGGVPFGPGGGMSINIQMGGGK